MRNSSTDCESTSYPISFTVKSKPVVTSINKSVCSGQSSNLSLTSDVAGTTYNWSVQSKSANVTGVTVGATGTSNPINHTLINTSTTSGTVVYRVTATANECTGTHKDITVTINPFPVASITGNTTICSGSSTTLTANPAGASYQWSTGGTTRSISVSNAGTYTATVTSNGCSTNASITTNMHPYWGTISQTGDLCTGGFVLLTAGAGSGYQWSTGAMWSQQIQVYWEGMYEVTYNTYAGCQVYAQIYVPSNSPEPGFPCNMARTRDERQDESMKETDDGVTALSIYPNPANDEITIHVPDEVETDVNVKLFDASGRQVRQATIEIGKTKTIIAVSDINAGFYVIQLESKSGLMARKKVMIRHGD